VWATPFTGVFAPNGRRERQELERVSAIQALEAALEDGSDPNALKQVGEVLRSRDAAIMRDCRLILSF
jgi:regulator of RNase E activity RraB